jgi:phospholipase A1
MEPPNPARPLVRIASAIGGAVLAASLARGGSPAPEAEDLRPAKDRASTADIERCAAIADDEERLACYDALAARPRGTFLERHWDLRGEGRLFRPWPHRPNYVLPVRWTDDPNEAPFSDTTDGETGEAPDVQSVEAKFQISFKTKLFDGVFGGPGDLWFGYTQQSHFQVYNASESRPFRETDFEPEAILAFPARLSWGAWTWRMIGTGFVHQSNGRSGTLSRSWNRIYALAAVEREHLAIHVRPWVRIDSKDADEDDNGGITDHIGRFETVVQWSPGRQVLLARGRSNLDPGGHKGSLQVDWFSPIGDRIRGQVQVFTGYGESLIDYDHSQTTVGVGILVFDPF